jgi:hypothetical protein
MHGAVLTAIHARIPMPTQDDHQTVQLDRAKAHARLWTMLSEGQADQIAGLKGVAAKAAAATSAEPAAATAAEKAAAAVEQVAKVERGEDVGLIPPPMTRAALLRMLGWTEAHAAHAVRMAHIGDDGMEELLAEITRRQKQSERAASRAVLRRRKAQHAG